MSQVWVNTFICWKCHKCKSAILPQHEHKIILRDVENEKNAVVHLCDDCDAEWGMTFRKEGNATSGRWSNAWNKFMKRKIKEVVSFT